MKSKSTFFIVLFMVFSAAVKANNLPIPVAANESITVTLFFPTEITKVIQPAVNYKFEYEPNASMATLVARKGAVSNLTVITKCGSIFSFLLEYNTEVPNFTYVLSAEQAIGKMEDSGVVAVKKNVQPKKITEKESTIVVKPKEAAETENKMTSFKTDVKHKQTADVTEALDMGKVGKGRSLYESNKEDYYEIFCENNYDQRARLKKPLLAGAGVTMQLNTIAADKNELYFMIAIENTLDTDFKTKDLNFYVRSGQTNKPLTMTPLYVFNSPNTIGPKEKINLVYVFKEFKLSPNQEMFIALDEVGGTHKKVMLKVNSRTINNAGK